MAGRTTSVALLGDTSNLQAELEKVGIVAGDMSKKIRGSAADAGRAMADLTKETGGSADEQSAAAGKAAAAWTEMAASMTRAQKTAGDAAARAAKLVGASVDEQRAAYGRAIATQAEYEKAQQRAADVAKSSSAEAAAAAKKSADEQIAAAKAASDAIEASAAKAKKAREGFAGFGGKVAAGAVIGGGASAFESVKGATDLQASMERLHTQAGASQKQVQALTKSVLGMAGGVATGPNELAQGMYHVTSSLNATLAPMSRVKDETNALHTAAQGAKMGNADLVDVTNALDAALVSGIKGSSNYNEAMGALNATVGAGDMSMQDLADAMGTGVAINAKEAGVSVNQLGGALAVLGDNNIRGARAGTLLASTLRIMKAPSEAGAEALHSVGISSLELAQDLRQGGLSDALADLKQKLTDSGANANQAGLILTRAFGGRQSQGVQILLDQLDRLKAKTKDVGSGAQNFSSDWSSYTKTLSYQIDQLKATVESLADKFGMYLIPKLEATGKAIEGVIGWMQKHKAEAEALATVITAVLGAAVTAYAYTKAVSFVNATKGMLSAIGSCAQGIGKAAASIASKLGGVSSSSAATETEVAASSAGTGASIRTVGSAAVVTETEVATAGEGMVGASEATAAGVDTAMGSTGIGLILVGLGLAAAELATHWSTVMSGMQTAVNAMVKVAEGALNKLIGLLNDAIGVFDKTIGKLTGAIGSIGKVGVGNVFGGGGSSASGLSATGSLLNNGLTASESAQLGDGSTNPSNVKLPSSGSNASKIAAALIAAGYSKNAVAGMLGNFATETGGGSLSAINTADSGTGASGMGGMGIAQWTEGRRTAEMSYAGAHGESATSLAAQVGYLIQTLKGTSLAKRLNSTTSASQAAALFDASPAAGGYEGGSDVARRESAAEAALKLLGSPSATSVSKVKLPSTSAALKKYLAAQSGASTKDTAAATSTIPVAVATMLQTAEALQGTKYTWGGGHGSTFDSIAELKKIGIDCSGFVSKVLSTGGVRMPGPQTTAGLPSYLEKGKGKDVTVYDRASGSQAHTIIDILGHYFESGGNSQYNPNPNHVSMLTSKDAAGELAGGGFVAYHPNVSGKLATDKQLKAMGLSGLSGSTTGLESSQASLQDEIKAIHEAARKAAEERRKSARTAGASLMTTYRNDAQTGSVTGLEHAIGWGGHPTITAKTMASAGLGTVVATPGSGALLTQAENNVGNARTGSMLTAAHDLNIAAHGGPGSTTYAAVSPLQRRISELGVHATGSEITKRLMPIVTAQSSHTPQTAAFQAKVEALVATGQTKMADKLVAAHKAAMESLAKELYAQQLTKDSESQTLQATEENDRTTSASDAAANQLTVVKAQSQKMQDAAAGQLQAVKDAAQAQSDAANAQVTLAKDQATRVSDAAAAQVTYAKDAEQLVSDAAQAQTQHITDMTQVAEDQFSAMAAAIKDQTTAMADASAAAVDLINDQSQTQVDTVDERGMYGLNLVAQQLQVQLDVMKTGFDQQVDLAQQQVDQLQAQADAAESAAQLQVDQVTAAQNQLVALAQQNEDTVTIAEDQQVAAAQAHMDAIQLSEDSALARAQARLDAVTASQDSKVAKALGHEDTVTVHEDQLIARASAHTDAVALKEDVNVQLAQTAVDLGANLTKSQQDVLASQLSSMQAKADDANATAKQQQSDVEDVANSLINQATQGYTDAVLVQNRAIQQATADYQAAQDGATAAIQAASDAYTNAQNIAAAAEQAAAANYQAAQDGAAMALASANQNLQNITGTYNVALAEAAQSLQGVQDTATQEEAALQARINLATADANTEFSGSGMTVNFYGMQQDNVGAITGAIDWIARTQLS